MITQEMESLRLAHVAFGYTMVGLVAFRIIWGLIGTRYARFTSFVPSFARIRSYIASMLTPSPQHYVGHNPVGSLSILSMVIVVGVHVAGAVFSNLFHRDRSIRSMIDGYKLIPEASLHKGSKDHFSTNARSNT